MIAVSDLNTLRDVLESAPGRWSQDQEAAAASLFSSRRRRVLRGLEDVEAARRRTAKRALRAEAAEILQGAACVALTAAENPGLFDTPVAFGWGPAAIAAQATRGGPFPRLLALAPADLEARAEAPEALALRGRSPADLARSAADLERRGERVVERWDALADAEDAARRAVTDRSAGLLDRAYFPLGEPGEVAPSIYVEPPELEPFRNALPLFGDVADAASTLADALSEGRRPLVELGRNPERAAWASTGERLQPASDLFAAFVPGRLLEPRVPEGSVAAFRLDPSPPRDGQIVLIDGLGDPETGVSAVLRVWRLETPQPGARRSDRPPRLRLDALAPEVPPIFVDEPAEADLRVVARLIDVLHEG